MNELCFTVAVLNLNKFLTIDFNKQKISSTCAQQILFLDYSNLQERRNVSKLYMIVGIDFLSMVLEMKVLNGIFYKTRCSNRNIIELK